MSNGHTNTFPKLHNAAWPGVVGKGGEGNDPPIDLDTMLDLTAAAEVDGRQVRRRRPVPVRPARRHRRQRRRPEGAGRPGQGRAAWSIGSVVAPVWPPTGGGPAMDPGEGRRSSSRRSARAAGSPRSSASWASAPTASSGSTRPAAPPTGRPTPRTARRTSPRPSSRPPRSPATTASGSPPRARSAGAACTRWKKMVDLLERVGEPDDRRLPGRHGPHAALHCSATTRRRTASSPRTSTGSDTARPRHRLPQD